MPGLDEPGFAASARQEQLWEPTIEIVFVVGKRIGAWIRPLPEEAE
jgi:hypothetical protein